MEYFPEYYHTYTLEKNKAVFPLANFTAVYVVHGARTAFFFSHVYSAAVHLVAGISELNTSVDL
jgi:hypothetical protein